jgi:hypothetical protein
MLHALFHEIDADGIMADDAISLVSHCYYDL